MLQPPFPSTPAYHARYTEPSTHNGAAILSLICAILWPFSFLITPFWNAQTQFAPMPDWLGTLLSFGFTLLPLVGIVSAVIGLVRSFTRPRRQPSRWQAIVGLIFGLMWIGAYFLIG